MDVVVLLTLTLNTFLHTIVLLLLSFLVVSLTYIVTKIAIDSFYNRNIQNPFRSASLSEQFFEVFLCICTVSI